MPRTRVAIALDKAKCRDAAGPMKTIGAHVSAAGGVQNAPDNAAAIGANAFALFTKNQRQWLAPPLSETAIAQFKARCQDRFVPATILPHNSYLTNLGNPDPEKRARSQAAFCDEMTRCQQLGLDRLNFHPGSHLDACSEEECLTLIASGINDTLERTQGVTAVLENTAGQGTCVGHRLEQLAEIIRQVNDQSRVGVCIDTCHAFAAGYDLRSKRSFNAFWREYERVIGWQYLRGLHLNDSKKALGSRVDRHAPLGQGHMGMDPFIFIMKDPRFDGLPLILETPEPENWAAEIATLRHYLPRKRKGGG
jgi:deoxyribonuclease IV